MMFHISYFEVTDQGQYLPEFQDSPWVEYLVILKAIFKKSSVLSTQQYMKLISFVYTIVQKNHEGISHRFWYKTVKNKNQKELEG